MYNLPNRPSYTTRTVSVTGLLDDAFQILKRHFILFFGIAAIVVVPFSLLIAYANARATPNYQAHVQHLRDLTDRVSGTVDLDQAAVTGAVEDVMKDIGKMLAIGGTLSVIEYSLMGAALAVAVAESYAERPTTIRRCYKTALARLAPTIASALAVGIGLVVLGTLPATLATVAGSPGLGVVLLMISMILVLFYGVRVSLYLQAVVLERQNVSSILRSYRLTAGFFWKTLGLLVLTTVTVALLIILTDTIVLHATDNSEPIDTVVNLIITTATMPLVLCAQTLLFLDLKTVREGFSTEQLVTDLNALQ